MTARSIGVAANPLHVVAVTGFVRDAGRVLLVPVLDRGWELPGGRFEEGEWLTAALEREVEEESRTACSPTSSLLARTI